LQLVVAPVAPSRVEDSVIAGLHSMLIFGLIAGSIAGQLVGQIVIRKIIKIKV